MPREFQRLTFSRVPDRGSFVLDTAGLGAGFTDPIPFDATNDQIGVALDAQLVPVKRVGGNITILGYITIEFGTPFRLLRAVQNTLATSPFPSVGTIVENLAGGTGSTPDVCTGAFTVLPTTVRAVIAGGTGVAANFNGTWDVPFQGSCIWELETHTNYFLDILYGEDTGVPFIYAICQTGSPGSTADYKLTPIADAVGPFTLTKISGPSVYPATMTIAGSLHERQIITLPVGANTGTWDLEGFPLDWDAPAAAVEEALIIALEMVVTVTGADGGPYTVTWADTGNQPLLTADFSGLGVRVNITVTPISLADPPGNVDGWIVKTFQFFFYDALGDPIKGSDPEVLLDVFFYADLELASAVVGPLVFGEFLTKTPDDDGRVFFTIEAPPESLNKVLVRIYLTAQVRPALGFGFSFLHGSEPPLTDIYLRDLNAV